MFVRDGFSKKLQGFLRDRLFNSNIPNLYIISPEWCTRPSRIDFDKSGPEFLFDFFNRTKKPRIENTPKTFGFSLVKLFWLDWWHFFSIFFNFFAIMYAIFNFFYLKFQFFLIKLASLHWAPNWNDYPIITVYF